MKTGAFVLLAAVALAVPASGQPSPPASSGLTAPTNDEDAMIEQSIAIADRHPEEGAYGPSACIAYSQIEASTARKWRDRAEEIDRSIPTFAASCRDAAAARWQKDNETNASESPWAGLGGFLTSSYVAIGVALVALGMAIFAVYRSSRPKNG